MKSKLLRAEDGVLRGFGHAEFDDALGGDLDGLASGRIAAHARLAIDELQLAETRNGEIVLGLLVSEFDDGLDDLSRRLLADVVLVRNFSDDL